jgi:hypothetical protein
MRLSELFGKFRYTAGSVGENGKFKRFFAELYQWDDQNKILWAKFPQGISSGNGNVILKGINKEENIYMVVNGLFDDENNSVKHISNLHPPLKPLFVKSILIARNIAENSPYTDLEIADRFEFKTQKGSIRKAI